MPSHPKDTARFGHQRHSKRSFRFLLPPAHQCNSRETTTTKNAMTQSASHPVESCDVPVVSYEDLVNKADLKTVIEEAFGYDGMGILAVSGVPGLNPKRETLLPLAFQYVCASIVALPAVAATAY